MFNFIVNLE